MRQVDGATYDQEQNIFASSQKQSLDNSQSSLLGLSASQTTPLKAAASIVDPSKQQKHSILQDEK